MFGSNTSIPDNTIAGNLAWCQNFSTELTADPAALGQNAAIALDVANLVADYTAAFDLAGVESRQAKSPGGYTKPNRAALYTIKASCLAVIRPLAFEIHANPAVSDEDKLLAGVVPRNFNRTPIFVPGTSPILGLQFASMGSHTLAFADSASPASKRKPFGAVGLQLFVGIDSVETPLSELRYYSTFTRNPAVVAFDPQDAGKVATYAGRWIGKRGDDGPWSATFTAVIMFSQVGMVPVT
jgi:hypothetical protein